MKTIDLEAELRTRTGKQAARRLRREGRIPAILYGGGRAPAPLSVDRNRLDAALKSSEHVIVRLSIEGGEEREAHAILRDIEVDPISRAYTHADFQRVRLDEKVRAVVKLVFTGSAAGVKEGGILDEHLREVEVEGKVLDIPGEIEVDVSGLSIGEAIHARDLRLPDGVTLLTDPERSVASVVPPAAEVEETPPAPAEGEEGATAAEGKGEGEGEGEAEGKATLDEGGK